jgi:hypothetical protein
MAESKSLVIPLFASTGNARSASSQIVERIVLNDSIRCFTDHSIHTISMCDAYSANTHEQFVVDAAVS